MDPAKCLEILGNRGTCGGSHDAHHGHRDPTPSQAAAEAAAKATAAGGGGSGGGQVINLTTGSNETRAAAEAASGLMATMGAVLPPLSNVAAPSNGGADARAPPPTSAPYSESEDSGRQSSNGVCNATSSPLPLGDETRDPTAGAENGGGDEADARGPGQAAPAPAAAAAAAAVEEGKVLKGMEGMSAGALVASFRRALEERVALYK
ncbi:unnamed protein product [Scytosiphon promiscuus]